MSADNQQIFSDFIYKNTSRANCEQFQRISKGANEFRNLQLFSLLGHHAQSKYFQTDGIFTIKQIRLPPILYTILISTLYTQKLKHEKCYKVQSNPKLSGHHPRGVRRCPLIRISVRLLASTSEGFCQNWRINLIYYFRTVRLYKCPLIGELLQYDS